MQSKKTSNTKTKGGAVHMKRVKTLYEEVYEEIKSDILAGKLKKGERLVSKRSIAEQFGVSVVTAENAIAQLIAEGYISAVQRSGYFIQYSGGIETEKREEKPVYIPAPRDNTPLSGAAALFPFSVWARLMRTVIAEQDTRLLKPVGSEGVYELRFAVSEYLYRCRGMKASPENIIIGAGSEYLYNLIIQLLGRDLCYCVENPCYDKPVKIYNLNAVRLVSADMDEYGIRTDKLCESVADVAHISPAHHFPSGAVMPIARRSEIMKWADEEKGRYIIEDDYDSEFRRTGLPVPALFSMEAKDRVIYINTFSQTLAPSVRISYMCLPDSLMKLWREKMSFYSCPVPAFEQYTLAKFISEGYFERHINRIKKYIYKNLETIISHISSENITIHEMGDGLHFTATVKENVGDFISKAEKCGMKIRPLKTYYLHGGESCENDYVVSYANADEAKVREYFGGKGE